MVKVFECFDYRIKSATTHFAVKRVREALQLHFGSIHVLKQFFASHCPNVARRDRNGFDAKRVTRLGRINGEFGENDRIVKRECDGLAAKLFRRPSDQLRRGVFGDMSKFAGMALVPILAKAARQIASDGSEGEYR